MCASAFASACAWEIVLGMHQILSRILSRILFGWRRREGYEVAVGPPQVITKLVDGKKYEPFEEAHVEVPQEHMGQVRPASKD